LDHTIVHFEIPADNVQKLKEFYSSLFGWKIERFPGPTEYWSLQTVPVDDKGMTLRPGVNGGMMPRQMPEQKPVNYISVESVDEYSKKLWRWAEKSPSQKWRFQEWAGGQLP